MRHKRLMLACGTMIRESDEKSEWVMLDIVDLPGVDVVHDLDVTPWPFEDEEFDQLVAFDIFEHVNDPLGFMSEGWRILKPGGLYMIHTTHWRGRQSYTDPTHKRFCTEETFDYWVPGTMLNERYGPAYARGCHFDKLQCVRGGDELQVVLRKKVDDGTG